MFHVFFICQCAQMTVKSLAYMSLPDVFWSCSKFLSVEIYAVYVCNLHSLYTILLYVLHKSYAVVCDFCQMHAHIFSLISTTIAHMFYRTKHLLHVIADKTAQYWHIILLMVLFGNFWPDLTFMYIFTCSLLVFFMILLWIKYMVLSIFHVKTPNF